jgi:hypothetical protein
MGVGNICLDLIINSLAGNNMEPHILAIDIIAILFGLAVYILPNDWLERATSFLLCCEKERMFLNIDYDVAASNFHTTY